ncbi:MAG: hypothetical protein V4598_11605 [Bdellovibrionota bacterium]
MIALLLMTPFMLLAETLHMAVLGGSGEPHNVETTIFDAGLERMGQFHRSHPDIKSEVLFNGGHAQTEDIARRGFGGSRPFTAQGYYQIIEEYKRKLNSGEIRNGEKILINLYSHGATRDHGETTHKIAAGSGPITNYDDMAGTTTVSVDALKSLRDLAKAKGVKLGIIDLSCHSGNSLNIADDNTCVISATGPDHYSGAGTSSFGALISGSLQSGKSLEEAFLTARAGFADSSFPMISSPAGKEIQQRLYNNETPFLYYYNPQSDKFTPYLEQIATSVGECRIDGNLMGLNTEIESLLRAGATPEVQAKLNAFRTALTDYHAYMRNIKRQMDEFGIGEIGKEYKLCSGNECETYTAKKIASTQYPYLITYYEEQTRTGSQSDRALARNQLNIMRQGQALQTRILSENPNLAKSAEFWRNFPDLQRQTSIMQSNVARSQRELYLEMYRRSAASGPNPCRDFKL